ncbi:hypothetical protein WG904_02705 [Pedobacter sp. Du54]|uniref:hypothetical protein n=1 Tax=Pedobacter anseongensis TaxID=3133439 RepID=UPI00309DFE53
MYIPIFIAILMGLLAPINQTAKRGNGTVYVKFNVPIVQDNTSETDSIPPGDDGINGPGTGTGTGGGTGQIPPPPTP